MHSQTPCSAVPYVTYVALRLIFLLQVKVMAMFDYIGAEADELSFKEGEVIKQVNPPYPP